MTLAFNYRLSSLLQSQSRATRLSPLRKAQRGAGTGQDRTASVWDYCQAGKPVSSRSPEACPVVVSSSHSWFSFGFCLFSGSGTKKPRAKKLPGLVPSPRRLGTKGPHPCKHRAALIPLTWHLPASSKSVLHYYLAYPHWSPGSQGVAESISLASELLETQTAGKAVICPKSPNK